MNIFGFELQWGGGGDGIFCSSPIVLFSDIYFVLLQIALHAAVLCQAEARERRGAAPGGVNSLMTFRTK